MKSRVWIEEQLKKRTDTRRKNGWFKDYNNTIIKLSESKKGDKNPNYGITFSESTKKKMSDAKRNKVMGINNPFYGKTHTKEVRKRLSIFHSNKTLSIETKEKIRNSVLKALENHPNYYDTNIERKVENYFLYNNILYLKQRKIGKYLVDFWLPESNLVIECDGDYWHSKPKTIEKDLREICELEDQGFLVVRLKGSEIINNFDSRINELSL